MTENEVPVEQGSQNPFSEENYPEIQFTQLSRIYDVLMTLVQLQSPTAAERLVEAHSKGTLVAPSPLFSGEFLFDSANAPSPQG